MPSLRIAPLLLVVYAAVSTATDIDVRVVRLGAEIPISNLEVVARTIAFVESSTIDSTKYAASPAAWQRALTASSLVHLRFPAPRDVTVDGRTYKVDDVLVPIPDGLWPEHVFARRGDEILSFTFFDPRAFRDLVWGSPFEYQNTPPWDALANLPNY
jgi:hypothetical protein